MFEDRCMKIFDSGEYLTFLDFLADIVKNRRFSSFTSGLEHILKRVAYVT